MVIQSGGRKKCHCNKPQQRSLDGRNDRVEAPQPPNECGRVFRLPRQKGGEQGEGDPRRESEDDGACRVHAALRHRGVRVGRKRVERPMRQLGLSGLIPKRRGRTMIRAPGVRGCDLAARDFNPTVLEKDLLRRRSFRTRQEARTAVFDYIEAFYKRSTQRSATCRRPTTRRSKFKKGGKRRNRHVNTEAGALEPLS
jgi:hypothetical protein